MIYFFVDNCSNTYYNELSWLYKIKTIVCNDIDYRLLELTDEEFLALKLKYKGNLLFHNKCNDDPIF